MCVCERERERESVSVCVCVCVWVWVWVWCDVIELRQLLSVVWRFQRRDLGFAKVFEIPEQIVAAPKRF